MKQTRLSFGTKRKDSPSSFSNNKETNSKNDIIVIDLSENSPTKSASPPTKKVRRTHETETASLADNVPKSPVRTSARRNTTTTSADVDKIESPVKLAPMQQSPAKTPVKQSLVKTPTRQNPDKISSSHTKEPQVTPLTKKHKTSSSQKDGNIQLSSDKVFRSPAQTSTRKCSSNTSTISASNKSFTKNTSSEQSPVKVPYQRTPTKTFSEQTPSKTQPQSSPTPTPHSTPLSQTSSATPSSQIRNSPANRTPRRSKTEIAYEELKKRKDREFRLKEKEEKIKQREFEKEKREEERLRREQEKKELKERKEQERLEKEKKREAEKLDRERKKEEERLEKEREREEKEKLRREKERKREEERLEKGREREEKEKLRKEKEEERRKKEDEKRREQKEEEAKKQKAKQAFKSFFVVKTIPNKSLPGGGGADAGSSGGPEDPSDGTKIGADDGTIGGIAFYNGSTFAVGAACSGSNGSLGKFKPFQLKKDMALAAIVPPAARARFDRNKIDEIIGRQLREQGEKQSDGKAADATVDNNVNSIKKADTQNESTMLYLDVLKKTNYRPLKAEKRKIHREREDTDCFVVGTENLINDQESTSGGRVRAKFLQFVENYRPAYYGTWRKTCPQITGRRPFNKFEDFDYSIDSDDEWEDVEGEVESIVGTDDEKDKEENVEDDYEEDDFFVPHGYLSESEEEESDDQPLDPAALKARIAARQEEFRAERKAGFQAKKMVAVCAVSRKGHNLEAEYQVLQQFKAVLLVASQDHPLKPSWEQEPEIINTPKSSKDHLEPKMLTDEALKVFCETAHGFQSGVRQLYEEFYKKWRSVSDVKIGLKSLKLTLTGTCKKSKNNRLVVNKDWVEKFGLKELDNDTPKEGTPSFSAKLLPDEVLPDLIKVAHGTSSTSQVITEFLNKMKDLKFGKAQVKRTLRTIAVFDHVHSCWLVRLELLKMHNLEELIKKIKAEEKPAKDKKDIHKKDTKEVVEEERTAGPGRNNKDQIAKNGFSHDSNSKDSFTNDTKSKENMPKGSTSKSLSIKKFFSSSSKGNGTLSNSSLTTPTTEGTPKVKKRIQLTTLSRTVTMKQDYKSRPVLNPEEVMVIDEDE